MNVSRILRQDIAPVGSAYLLFLVVLVWYARARRPGSTWAQVRRPGQDVDPNRSWPSILRIMAMNLAAAYLMFALIIAIFYLVLGGQPRDFVPQSLLQGSVLAFGVVLPAFVVLTLLGSAWRRRGLTGRR